MKAKVIISVVALLLCIGTTVGLRIATDRASVDYEEVQVTVVSSETKKERVLKRWQTVYEVMVRYEGRTYELENTHGTAGYSTGREVTAFLSNGALYANIEGVKTSTPLATVYFVFLFISFGMIVVTVSVITKARRGA